MNLPMSWEEWADHDGVALAARVAKGELTAVELAAQAAAAIAQVILRFPASSRFSRMRSQTPAPTAPRSTGHLPDFRSW